MKLASTHMSLVGHQREQGCRGIDMVADLDLVDLGDDAVHRRMHHGVGEIEQGAVEHGLRLAHHGQAVRAGIRIAAQIGQGAGGLLLGRGELLLAGLETCLGLIELGARGNALRLQFGLPAGFALLIGEIAARRRFVGQPLAVDAFSAGTFSMAAANWALASATAMVNGAYPGGTAHRPCGHADCRARRFRRYGPKPRC